MVVSLHNHQNTLTHIEGNCDDGWKEGQKQLPMMVFGTEQLAPLERS